MEKKENEKEIKKGKGYIINKIIITILILFIAGLVVADFILSEPKYEITVCIVICLALIVILALSDMFDNLSIPQVLSLSRNIKEVKKENSELKETNLKLMEQVVNIKNSNSQNMVVQLSGSSNIEDVNENKEEMPISDQKDNNQRNNRIDIIDLDMDTPDFHERYKYRKNIEIFLLKKALDNGENGCDVKYNVEMNFSNIDTIMKNRIIFDALKKGANEMYFFDVKLFPSLSYSYELYYILKTLEAYREISKTYCKLILLYPSFDKGLEKYLVKLELYNHSKEKIKDMFDSSIKDGLLEIREIPITKKEIDNYMKTKENQK